MKNQKNFSINLTDIAVKKIKKLIIDQKEKKSRFRIYISSGGCNGFRYGFVFDSMKNKEDLVIKKSGIELIIDFKSLEYVNGGYVDYVEKLEESYFIIVNPNAKTTCSCGFSFGL